jgi:hypothetical protein
MSNPIATPADLTTFLGQTVDDARATQILALAQAFCEDVVTPLPASAKGIVLAAAGRTYVNPESVQFSATGPYSAQRPVGVYLTRAERATLRRGAGRGGASSTSVLVAAANAVQTITVAATAGTYTLSFSGVVTAPIAFDATAADMQAAHAALAPIGVGNVSVNGAYRVEFVNNLGAANVPTLVADGTGLTGTATVSVVEQGVPAPGSNLPAWEYDYAAPVFGAL